MFRLIALTAIAKLHVQPTNVVLSRSNGCTCRWRFVSISVGRDLAVPGSGVLPSAAVVAGSSPEPSLRDIVVSTDRSPPLLIIGLACARYCTKF